MDMRKMTVTTLLSLTALTMPFGAEAVEFTCWNPSGARSLAEVRDYWTPERIAAAAPDGETAVPDRGVLPEKLKELDDTERAPIGDAPYKFGGKLFYTRDGNDYSASAQFVAENNIVIGAAHSLWKGGSQATNIAFHQGYANGGGTVYAIDRAAVLLRWTEVADNPPSLARSQYDYSVMRTMANSAVGKYDLGIDAAHVDDDVTVTGYPGRLEGGAYMYRETARITVQAGTAFDARPHPMYGGGASGGAWFVSDGAAFKAVSVVSSGAADGVYGPSFTQDTADLIATVKNGCP